MPYELKKVVDGYKVCKQDDMKVCFSKRGLPYDNAIRQMRAIIISERSRGIDVTRRKVSKKGSRKGSKKGSRKVAKKGSKKGSLKGSKKGGRNVVKKL